MAGFLDQLVAGFSGKKDQVAAPAGGSPQGTPQGGAAPANSQQPAADSATPSEPASPLDQFKDLWQPPENSGADTKPKGVFGDVDPSKFMEAAGKIDFAKVLKPEQLQAISAGGEGAMQAFAQAMNAVSQQTYAQSMFASTQLIQEALGRAETSFSGKLPDMVKRLQAGDTLRNENPIFKNPAVKPVMDAVQSQMATKYPDASATELTKMTQNFILALSEGVIPKTQTKTTSKESGENTTNWDTWFNPNA